MRSFRDVFNHIFGKEGVLLIDLLCLLFSGTENATEGAPAVATGELLLIYNTGVHETARLYFMSFESSTSMKGRFNDLGFTFIFTHVSMRKSVRH